MSDLHLFEDGDDRPAAAAAALNPAPAPVPNLERLDWFTAPAAAPVGFKAILDAALAAGAAAHRAAVPEPMTVIGGGKEYFVSEGMCGFSWVKIKGNNGFGAYCKKIGLATPAYGGGLRISYPFPSQSYDRGQAWALAFSDVLKDNGIFAYADGRLD